MKKYLAIFTVLIFAGLILGCGKKKDTLEQMQEPMSMESLTTMNTTQASSPETNIVPATKSEVVQMQTTNPPPLETLPPQAPYKPTVREIQTALKNAGYYAGNIDGKSGPMTKKAIEEFQKANSLTADGKVGPKTWAVLGTHLNTAPTP